MFKKMKAEARWTKFAVAIGKSLWPVDDDVSNAHHEGTRRAREFYRDATVEAYRTASAMVESGERDRMVEQMNQELRHLAPRKIKNHLDGSERKNADYLKAELIWFIADTLDERKDAGVVSLLIGSRPAGMSVPS